MEAAARLARRRSAQGFSAHVKRVSVNAFEDSQKQSLEGTVDTEEAGTASTAERRAAFETGDSQMEVDENRANLETEAGSDPVADVCENGELEAGEDSRDGNGEQSVIGESESESEWEETEDEAALEDVPVVKVVLDTKFSS